MRYAIITDIHANIEALETVLAKIDELSVDRIVCLGDLVGYYANPNETVELLIKRDAICIMGNHDVVACGLLEPHYFNPAAAQAILWTRDQLTQGNKEYLMNLPDSRLIEDTFHAVHGSMADRDEYLLFRPEIEHSFELLHLAPDLPQVAFFGHTHRRVYYEHDGQNLYSGKQEHLALRPNSSYLINPGSVGQPRDGDPRAAFCVFDAENREIDFIRVNYDVDATSGKVEKLPFGEGLARRLYRGT